MEHLFYHFSRSETFQQEQVVLHIPKEVAQVMAQWLEIVAKEGGK